MWGYFPLSTELFVQADRLDVSAEEEDSNMDLVITKRQQPSVSVCSFPARIS